MERKLLICLIACSISTFFSTISAADTDDACSAMSELLLPKGYVKQDNGNISRLVFNFKLREILEVDEKEERMKLSLYFEVGWMDERIETSNWPLKNLSEMSIDPNCLQDKFWTPRLEIYSLDKYEAGSVFKPMSSASIDHRKWIYYEQRAVVDLFCKMSFKRYPLDVQKCQFVVGPYDNAIDGISCNTTSRYTWDKNIFDVASKASTNFHLRLSPIHPKSEIISGEEYQMCGFEVEASRPVWKYIVQAYLPCTMVVLMTWIGFFSIDNRAKRISNLLLSMLAMINLYNSQKSLEPPSTVVNALDWYFMGCIFMAILPLIPHMVLVQRGRPTFTWDHRAKTFTPILFCAFVSVYAYSFST